MSFRETMTKERKLRAHTVLQFVWSVFCVAFVGSLLTSDHISPFYQGAQPPLLVGFWCVVWIGGLAALWLLSLVVRLLGRASRWADQG
jgi:hypothetical protein